MSDLDWPAGFERTPHEERERTSKFEASLARTTDDIETEMGRMDVEKWRAEIENQHTKSSGLPLHNANPDDPGFVLRWTDEGEQFAVACDAYTGLRDNCREVYLWVHETRMRSQREVATGQSEFAAAQLPSGEEDVVAGAGEAAHEVLGVAPDASEREVERAFREGAKTAHADTGGSNEEFICLKEAREAMLE